MDSQEAAKLSYLIAWLERPPERDPVAKSLSGGLVWEQRDAMERLEMHFHRNLAGLILI